MAEVGAMDPQQRLLLELGYGELHAYVRRRSLLVGSNSGVFQWHRAARQNDRAAAVGACVGVRGDGRQRIGSRSC